MLIRSQQRAIDELQTIILDTLHLIERFESKAMQTLLSADYALLHDILEAATQQQRALQKALLLSQSATAASLPAYNNNTNDG